MKSRHWILTGFCAVALGMAMTVGAQNSASLTAPDLRGSLPQLPPPPVPVDENGNPIPVQAPSAEQLEAQRLEQERLVQEQRVEAERIAEANRQSQETARQFQLILEQEQEQKRFHDRVMWAIYIGLGLFAVFVGSRVFGKKD